MALPETATEAEIKHAYRKLAVQHHPDKNPDDPHAEDKFKEAAEAYSVLSDPQKRAAYDRFGHQASARSRAGFDPGFSNIEDIFDMFGFGDMFGGRSVDGGRPSSAGPTFATTSRSRSRMRPPARTKSSASRGSRHATNATAAVPKRAPKPETCVTCGGSGQTRYQQGFFSVMRTCPNCQGKGQIIRTPCKKCRGQGRIEKERRSRSRSRRVSRPVRGCGSPAKARRRRRRSVRRPLHRHSR